MSDEPRYTVYTRTWWKSNPAWPDGREPGLGRKRIIARNVSWAEARHICQQWNTTHRPGKLSKKAEFEQQ